MSAPRSARPSSTAPTPEAPRHHVRRDVPGARWPRIITLMALAAATGVLVWTLKQVGLAELADRAVRIGPWFAVALGIEAAVAFADAAALRGFLRPEEVPFRSVVAAQVACRSTNVLTPLGSAGELLKVTMLFDRVSPARAVTAVLLHNLVAFGLSILLSGIGALLAWRMLPGGGAWLLAIGVAASALVVAAPALLWRRQLTAILDGALVLRVLGSRRIDRWRGKLSPIEAELHRAIRRPRDLLVGLAWSVVSRVGTWASTTILIVAAGAQASVAQLVAILATAKVLQWISMAVPLGLGAAEAGHYAVFAQVGVDPGVGVTTALARRAIQLVYASVGLFIVVSNETLRFTVRAARASSSPASPRADSPEADRGMLSP